MDIWGAILILVRRYYLTLPIAAIAIALGWTYTRDIAPEYHASGTLVLLGPTAVVTKDVPQPANPFAQLGTATVGAAIQLDVTSPSSLQELISSGNSTNFSVTPITRTPLITVSATSASPAQAASTVTRLFSIIQADLAARQRAYVPHTINQDTAQVLATARVSAADTKSKHKAEAIVAGVAVIVAVLLTLIIDGILVRRSRKRDAMFAAPDLDDEVAIQRPSVVKS